MKIKKILSRAIRNPRYFLSSLRNIERISVSKYIGKSKSSLNFLPSEDIIVSNSWDWRSKKILEEVREFPGTFLRQTQITKSLHPNQQWLAKKYLSEMANDDFIRNSVLTKLHDLPVGDPYLCNFFPFASPLSIQHAYYLFVMYKHFQVFLPNSNIATVLEIGGGYGNFFRIINSFGYRGKFTILDIPEMQVLQKHYLSMAISREDLQNKVAFLSANSLGNQNKKIPNSMFWATFSLNEMALGARKKIVSQIHNYDYFFIAYDLEFDGVDNREYFSNLESKLSNSFRISHFKDRHRKTWFFIGQKRN
jgi:hypothetical protein